MILVDTHCHLTHELYKDKLDAVLERAKQAGVKAIICSGVNVPTNREVLELAKKYEIVKASLGIYPVDALGIGADETGLARQEDPINLDEEFKFIESQKDNIVAVGEVGLDYHWVKDAELQKKERENFEKIIAFVEKLGKPIVIHTRSAEADCLDMLESSNLKKVVLHSFTGRKNLIKRAADLGYYFSVPAAIEQVPQFKIIAEIANINQLLSETDGPWLSPIKGQVNEPANVIFTIRNIAKIKGFTEEEVANNIWLNFQRLFS